MFADVSFSTESLVVIAGLLASLTGAIAFLFRLLMETKEREHAKTILDLEGLKKSYAEIAGEALKSATETANYYRLRDGKPPLIPLAAVVSESHSPSTAKQRETAAIATMRATLAAVKLLVGQEPRPEPERKDETATDKLPS